MKLHPGRVCLGIPPASPCTGSVLSAHTRLLCRASSSARSPLSVSSSFQLPSPPPPGAAGSGQRSVAQASCSQPCCAGRGNCVSDARRSPRGGDLRVLSKLGHRSQVGVWPLPTHSAHQHCQLSSEWSLCGSLPKPEM